MTVYFVGAGPGDPKLITVRGKELLESCRCCIYAGSLVPPEVLGLIPADAEKHDSASMDLPQIIDVMRRMHQQGTDVVRLHTGDPSIFGATREQMNELDKLGIAYETVPGVSSFQAAAAALNLELTAPEEAQTIILGRVAGRTPVPDEQDLDALGRTRATLCLFLSVHKMGEIAEKLAAHYGRECPAAVVARASWPDQQVITGTLADIGEKVKQAKVSKTAMVLVGWALSRDNAASRLYAADFTHGYRKGSE